MQFGFGQLQRDRPETLVPRLEDLRGVARAEQAQEGIPVGDEGRFVQSVNLSPGLSTTTSASVSLSTRRLKASGSCSIGGKVL